MTSNERSELPNDALELTDDDGEVVAQLADGWTLRSGIYPDSGTGFTSGEYVRLCRPDGTEYAYWDQSEWTVDPALVMGAIINSAAGLRFEEFNADDEAQADEDGTAAWRYEVRNGDTLLGYEDWVRAQQEDEAQAQTIRLELTHSEAVDLWAALDLALDMDDLFPDEEASVARRVANLLLDSLRDAGVFS